MHIQDILPLYLGSAREVVDITPDDGRVDLALGLPEAVSYRRLGTVAAPPEVGPQTLLVAVVGPRVNAPDVLAPLRGLRPGGRGIIFTTWPLSAFPYDRLVGPLAEAGCAVTDARLVEEAADPVGVHAALVVERVEQAAPHGDPGGGPHDALQLTNRVALAGFVATAMSERVAELESAAARLSGLAERVAALDGQLNAARRRQARSDAALRRLESSVTLQLGRIVVQGVRHPVRGVVAVPRDLVRLGRRWRRGPQVPAAAARPAPARPVPDDRVVRLGLPAKGAAHRDRLVLTAPRDMIVPRRLDENGLAGYEPDTMACFLAACDVAGPGAVFDIGANVGIFAAVASAMTSRQVRAFEPVPALAEVSRRFARDNELDWATETVALGADNGTATFYLSDKSDSSNSLAEGFRPSSAQISVQVETLDSYVGRTGMVPAVLKIDTESTEPDVIAGAAQTFAERRPWIVCEVLAGRVEDRLTAVMEPLGYHWYQIRDEIPYQESDEIVGDRTYRHLNWLFAPEPPDERFWAAVREWSTDLSSCPVERG
jgi:FkbM family methyltransferase